MMGSLAGGGLMLLWWLISLGILFFVIYEAVYLAISRALREHGRPVPQRPQDVPQQPHPPSAGG